MRPRSARSRNRLSLTPGALLLTENRSHVAALFSAADAYSIGIIRIAGLFGPVHNLQLDF